MSKILGGEGSEEEGTGGGTQERTVGSRGVGWKGSREGVEKVFGGEGRLAVPAGNEPKGLGAVLSSSDDANMIVLLLSQYRGVGTDGGLTRYSLFHTI